MTAKAFEENRWARQVVGMNGYTGKPVQINSVSSRYGIARTMLMGYAAANFFLC